MTPEPLTTEEREEALRLARQYLSQDADAAIRAPGKISRALLDSVPRSFSVVQQEMIVDLQAERKALRETMRRAMSYLPEEPGLAMGTLRPSLSAQEPSS